MATSNFSNRTLWTGDNLEIMRGMNSGCIDLIYLDPPFNSNANYAAPVGSKAAGSAFRDTWTLRDVDAEWINLIEAKHPALYRVLLAAMTDSDKSYLAYMAVRLLEMRRTLKPTGSIYLHCDPTMSHYLKLVMDAVLGKKQYRNEIVWCYQGGGRSKSDFGRKHDVILRYALPGFIFNADAVRVPYEGAGKNRTDASKWGSRRIGNTEIADKPNPSGKVAEDWWRMPQLNSNAPERVGYPTQKPLALLDRIIKASCPDDGIVLDPFCGCATTCVAADALERQWVGIDISPKTAELARARIDDLTREIVHRTDLPQRTDMGEPPPYNCVENRNRLYGQQGGDCNGCGEHFQARHFEVDHIISRNKGGTDHIENLRLLCGSCNRIKGDRGMEYLKAKLQLHALRH